MRCLRGNRKVAAPKTIISRFLFAKLTFWKMYKLLGGFAYYLRYQEIKTDCAIFRLHNLFTSVLLFACSVIITATQFVGQPIQCLVDGLPKHVVNTYCWISSTFTMPEAFRRQVKQLTYDPKWNCTLRECSVTMVVRFVVGGRTNWRVFFIKQSLIIF